MYNNFDLILDVLKQNNVDVELLMDRFLNDKHLYLTCLNAFFTDNDFIRLNSCVKNKNYLNISAISHTLYGAALNLGIESFFASLFSMQLISKDLEYDDVEKLYTQLQIEIDNFTSKIL